MQAWECCPDPQGVFYQCHRCMRRFHGCVNCGAGVSGYAQDPWRGYIGTATCPSCVAAQYRADVKG